MYLSISTARGEGDPPLLVLPILCPEGSREPKGTFVNSNFTASFLARCRPPSPVPRASRQLQGGVPTPRPPRGGVEEKKEQRLLLLYSYLVADTVSFETVGGYQVDENKLLF